MMRIFFLLVALPFCSSPTVPDEFLDSYRPLSTPWGVASVYTNGNSFDEGAARHWIASGYEKGVSQHPAVENISMNGVRIEVHADLGDNGRFRFPATLKMQVGIEQVLRHELQHYFCYSIYGEHEDKCALVDHPGGYNLRLNPL